MNPVEEEKQALAQQEEFERRLFAAENNVVLCAVPVSKGGPGVDSTKQYFLVVTINKRNTSDCKIHTVRVRDDPDNPLSIRKTTKIKKILLFEGNTNDTIMGGSGADSNWSFKLHYKNGIVEIWNLSPNSYRSVELFAFMIYNIHRETTNRNMYHMSLKPWEEVELQVHGREWLDRIFSNSKLYRRINSIQQEIFTPIYSSLSKKGEGKSGGDDGDGDGGGKGKKNHDQSDVLPFMTDEQMLLIQRYMKECKVDVQNIHLLESKLVEKQRNLVKDNIKSFDRNEEEMQRLVKNVGKNVDTLQHLKTKLENSKRYVERMDRAMRKIKVKNKELAIQDHNYQQLTTKLEGLINKLELSLIHKQRLKEPNLSDGQDYGDALNAAKTLIDKLELEFPDGLEGMEAVRAKKKEFQELKRDFCSKAKEFFSKEFEKIAGAKTRDKNNPFAITSHAEIHQKLGKHMEMMRVMDQLDVTALVEIQKFYEKSFAERYMSEFRDLFKAVNGNISNTHRDCRMAAFKPYKLEDFRNSEDIDRDEEKSELSKSKSNLSTASGGMSLKNTMRMPTLDESNPDSDRKGRMSIIRAYQVLLEQFLPLLLSELSFCVDLFEFSPKNLHNIPGITKIMKNLNTGYNNALFRSASIRNDGPGRPSPSSGPTGASGDIPEHEQVTLHRAEGMIKAMFYPVSAEFSELIDKADKMDRFNTLHMLIVTERTLHTYQLESDFLASFLTQLQQKLAMLWNKFISSQCDWITSSEKKVKQAGVLVPILKFPPFCNQMYQIIVNANHRLKSLLQLDLPSKKRAAKRLGDFGDDASTPVSHDIEAAFKSGAMNKNSNSVVKYNRRDSGGTGSVRGRTSLSGRNSASANGSVIVNGLGGGNSLGVGLVNVGPDGLSVLQPQHSSNSTANTTPHYHIQIDSPIRPTSGRGDGRLSFGQASNMAGNGANGANGANGGIEFVESEHVSMTVHKMTSALFRWLDEQSRLDLKYRDVCLMENFHYFYEIFTKMGDGVRALDEHVHKAKKEYRLHCRDYVRWSVKYECDALTKFWDKLNHHVQTEDDLEVISVWVPIEDLKKVIKEFLESEKKIDARINTMWKRLKKHLPQNEELVVKVWRKIAEYFLNHYKRLRENIDKCYHSASKEISKIVSEEHILQAFKSHMPMEWEAFDDNSSLASTSIGGSSVVSGITGITAVSMGSGKGNFRARGRNKYPPSSKASNSSD